MSLQWKLVILAGIGAIFAVPLFTVHATVEHLFEAEVLGFPRGTLALFSFCC